MPDDMSAGTDEEQAAEAEAPTIPHDDIVQRLLEHQRQLREGADPAEAGEIAARSPAAVAVAQDVEPETGDDTIVVDLTEAESDIELAEAVEQVDPEITQAAALGGMASIDASAPPVSVWAEPVTEVMAAEAAALSDRVAEVEATLQRVARMIGDLRAQLQEMAIEADEHLAAIEDALAATPLTAS